MRRIWLATALLIVAGYNQDGLPNDDVETSAEVKCPTPKFGPKLVAHPARFCIDETEVSQAQYAAWLSTSPPTSGQVAECAFNTSYQPSCDWNPTSNKPVVCVDWCDAAAFCKAASKRLCGKIGGGANPYDAFLAESDQWLNACLGTPEQDDKACNGWMTGPRTTRAVGSMTGCASPQAVKDLVGNVYEWEDSCSASTGGSDKCRVRGSSFTTAKDRMDCRGDSYLSRQSKVDDVGFRCCAL